MARMRRMARRMLVQTRGPAAYLINPIQCTVEMNGTFLINLSLEYYRKGLLLS